MDIYSSPTREELAAAHRNATAPLTPEEERDFRSVTDRGSSMTASVWATLDLARAESARWQALAEAQDRDVKQSDERIGRLTAALRRFERWRIEDDVRCCGCGAGTAIIEGAPPVEERHEPGCWLRAALADSGPSREWLTRMGKAEEGVNVTAGAPTGWLGPEEAERLRARITNLEHFHKSITFHGNVISPGVQIQRLQDAERERDEARAQVERMEKELEAERAKLR